LEEALTEIKKIYLEFSQKALHTKIFLIFFGIIILLNLLTGKYLLSLCFIPSILSFWNTDPNTRNQTSYDFSLSEYISIVFVPLLVFPIVHGFNELFVFPENTKTLIFYSLFIVCFVSISTSSFIYFSLLKQRQAREITRTVFEKLYADMPYQNNSTIFSSPQSNQQPTKTEEDWDSHYTRIQNLAKEEAVKWFKVKKIKTSRKILLIQAGFERKNIFSQEALNLSNDDLETYIGIKEYASKE
jgi:hypothetical protein